MKTHVSIVSELDDSTREIFYRELRTFNLQNNPAFWAKLESGEHESRALNVVAYDEAGKVAGGLIGSTRLSWLKIEILCVRADVRRGGIGRQLLSTAEAEAIRRGCKYAFTDTMDYQAPDFYHRLGYRSAGTIPDWDSHGHTKHFLTKNLPAKD
jgi:predicted N-acetyltransferase YhbS